MTILPYRMVDPNDPILNKPCKKVEKITPEIQNIIDTLRHVLRNDFKNTGIGLSANQIGFSYRICAINFDFKHEIHREKHLNEIWINPKIIWSSKKENILSEGCLSIPGIEGDVKRPAEVKIEAFNDKMEKKIFRAKNYYSRIMQHEIDHLNGILFTSKIIGFPKKVS